MQSLQNSGLTETSVSILDRAIAKLEQEKATLKKRFRLFYLVSTSFFTVGLALLVISNALDKQAVFATILSAVLLIIGGIAALVGAGAQTNYYVKNRPYRRFTEVRAGLENVGFRYANHREFFGKFWVFHEADGGRFAFVDPTKPFSPFIADSTAYVSLKLDETCAFIGKLNETQPQIRHFFIHPDFRYRVKKKPVYEKAYLEIINGQDDVLPYQFNFNNAMRKQFISLISYVC